MLFLSNRPKTWVTYPSTLKSQQTYREIGRMLHSKYFPIKNKDNYYIFKILIKQKYA